MTGKSISLTDDNVLDLTNAPLGRNCFRDGRRSSSVLAICLMLALLSFCRPAVAVGGDNVITVAQDGSGDFMTITQAIENAVEGTTIEIAPGLYQETIQMPTTRGITLTSTDPDDPEVVANTIIRGGPGATVNCSGNKDQPVVEHMIQGLTIRNQFGDVCVNVLEGSRLDMDRSNLDEGGKGLRVQDGAANLNNCTIRDQVDEQGFGTGVTVFGENGNCSLNNCDVINNVAFTGGGFLISGGGQLTINQVNFTGNQGSQAGGAGVVDGANSRVDILNSNFTNNQSTDGPGTVAVTEGSAPNMVGNSFDGNSSGTATIAVFRKAGGGGSPTPLNSAGIDVPVIANCTFCNNVSNGSFDEGAGAILCDGVSPFITDCTFIENTASIEAGAIRNTNGANPLIERCLFRGNIADRVAGAIMNQNGSMPMLVDCTFDGNMTINPAAEGGAVVNDGASPLFDNCHFVGNSSADTGAVHSEDNFSFPANVVFFGCSFEDNAGGTIKSFDAGLSMSDCQLQNNLQGTVLSCSGSETCLQNCHFAANQDRAIFLNDTNSNASTLLAKDCTFDNHTVSSDGGAVRAFDTQATFANCSFTNNHAGPNGGALLIVNCQLVLEFCHLENNSCDELGGAIACFNSSDGTLIGCNFAGSSCGVSGGAVYFSESSIAGYFSCAFSGNQSTQDGGAITCLDQPGDTISNCTFANNSANQGGAIFGNNSTTLEVNNSIIWENGNAPLHLESGSSANVSFCNVQGGFAGMGNLDTDPMFENAAGTDGIAGTADDDLRLQSNSPMIDAANNNFVPLDNLDVDEDGDQEEPLPLDLNQRIRFVDHPDVPDVGVGDAPIIDMGAIEFSDTLLGDVNLDGAVNLLDVDPFIERVGTGSFQLEADTNLDGAVNLLDIAPFIAILGS